MFVNVHNQQKQFSRSAHQMSTVGSPQGTIFWVFKEPHFQCGCGYTLEICSKFTSQHFCYDETALIFVLFIFFSYWVNVSAQLQKEVKTSIPGLNLWFMNKLSSKLWAYEWNILPATNCNQAQNCAYNLSTAFDKFMRQFS